MTAFCLCGLARIYKRNRLVFSTGTVFFSHNNPARTVFFSQFQPSFSKPNGAYGLVVFSCIDHKKNEMNKKNKRKVAVGALD